MLGHASAAMTLDRYAHLFGTTWTPSRTAWTRARPRLLWTPCGPGVVVTASPAMPPGR